MAPGAIPNPDRVPKEELLSPGLGFLVAAELLEKTFDVLAFLGQEQIYRRRGGVRGWTSRPGGTRPPPQVQKCLGGTWRLWASPGLVFLALEVFWRKRISVIFWEFSKHFGFWTFSTMHRHNKQKLALGILSIG